jgi:hypothetical protein
MIEKVKGGYKVDGVAKLAANCGCKASPVPAAWEEIS